MASQPFVSLLAKTYTPMPLGLVTLLLSAQRPAHGIDTGGESPLEHGHREADGTSARRIFPCRLDGLILYVPSELVVEVELLVADLERGSMDDSLGRPVDRHGRAAGELAMYSDQQSLSLFSALRLKRNPARRPGLR